MDDFILHSHSTHVPTAVVSRGAAADRRRTTDRLRGKHTPPLINNPSTPYSVHGSKWRDTSSATARCLASGQILHILMSLCHHHFRPAPAHVRPEGRFVHRCRLCTVSCPEYVHKQPSKGGGTPVAHNAVVEMRDEMAAFRGRSFLQFPNLGRETLLF